MSLNQFPKASGCTLNVDHQRGVGMIEVLVTLVILTTTLLGATVLQLTGLSTNKSSYYRSQASLLAYDIADRIRFNAEYALVSEDNYAIDTTLATVPDSPECITSGNGCSQEQLNAQDIREWSEHFFDVVGVGNDNAAYRSRLPNGDGVVAVDGATFTVTITWDELDWNVDDDSNKDDVTKTFSMEFLVAN